MLEPTTDPVHLPAGPRAPRIVQGALFLAARPYWTNRMADAHGTPFRIRLPIVGKGVVVADPATVKAVLTASDDVLTQASTLGAVFGAGSLFSLDGEQHRARRKLLVPTFHGKRMANYEDIVEEEVRREVATWPHHTSFPTLPSMMRITVNAILRAVFGAEGSEYDELRVLLPRMVELGSRISVMPFGTRDFGVLSPWHRLMKLRRRYDDIVASMIAAARADPNFEMRADVLAMMLRATYDDGSHIPDQHVADELLTLLAAGHETTATTLAWAIERLRRHPVLLAELYDEVDRGESILRQRTIWEVQRTRPVIEGVLRRTRTRTRLGEWVIPAGNVIIASAILAHGRDESFDDPSAFDPHRYTERSPDSSTWIPYGGGIRRCIGATFANMEMDVTLRTILQDFALRSTREPGEAMRSRGVATAPAEGGVAVIARRESRGSTPAAASAVSAS